MKVVVLNGWLRLFVIVSAIWLGLISVLFFVSLPKVPNESEIEQIALFKAISEIEKIQEHQSGDSLYEAVSKICDEAQMDSQINTNKCLQLLMAPDTSLRSGDRSGLAAEAILQNRIAKPIQKRLIPVIRAEQNDEFWSFVKDQAPRYAGLAMFLPMILLVSGVAVAWVRKGFSNE